MRIGPGTFTDDARTIMFHADAHAARLGHAHRGGELTAIGVDPAAVRDRIEASFGPDALARAGRVTRKKPRRFRGLPPGPIARWQGRRDARRMFPLPPVRPAPAGLYRADGARPAGHIPPTPDAWNAVNRSIHEAMTRHETRIRAEHLALAFTAMTTGLVPSILSALETSAPALRTAILERNWQAG